MSAEKTFYRSAKEVACLLKSSQPHIVVSLCNSSNSLQNTCRLLLCLSGQLKSQHRC
jgi:hypothetical protein